MRQGIGGRLPQGVMARTSTLSALALGLLFSSDIAAQDLTDERRSVREREQLEYQQRLRSLQRQPLRPDAPQPAPTTAQSPSAQCWWIKGVRLSGNQLIAQDRITAALQAHLSPCMDSAQINRLLAAITGLYVQDGYIASRPQLLGSPQDRQPLDIVITEGFVEAIELGDPNLPLSLRSAFGDLLGQPLQLRTLERGLEQLNRLRSFDLTADIEPGTTAGASRIVIRAQSRSSRWSLGAHFNNSGKPDIGRQQLQVAASLDSPLHLNDLIHASVGQTLDAGPAMSRSASLYYSLPWQAWTFSLNAAHAEFRIPLKHDLHGRSTLLGAGVERSLWRDQQRLLSATLRLDQKASDTFLGDQQLGIQSPRLLNAEAGLNLLWVQQGIWTAYLGYSRGLGNWDGRDTVAAQANAPRARFGKWRGTLSYLNQRPWAGRTWQWQSQLSGQYSNDPLPPIEQQSLTDEYAVRGLRDLSLSASTAANWRNTLSLNLPLTVGWSLEPHLGVDLGWRRIEGWQRNSAEPLASSGKIAGAALGVALIERRARLSLAYQHSLYLQDARLPPGYWRLELSLKL